MSISKAFALTKDVRLLLRGLERSFGFCFLLLRLVRTLLLFLSQSFPSSFGLDMDADTIDAKHA